MKVKILTANFSTMANCLPQNLYSHKLTLKPSPARKTTLLTITNSEVHGQVYQREANNKQMLPNKTTNPDELLDNELLGQTNRLEVKRLSVESIN